MAEGNAAAMKEKEQGNAAYKSKNFPKVLFSAVFDSGISINSKNKFVYKSFLGCWTGTNSQSSTSIALPWIQCKLGKQYLLNKVTPPWESNPEPFSYPGNYGYHRSVCWVKKFTCGHLPQIPSKIGPPLLPTIRLRADTILTP